MDYSEALEEFKKWVSSDQKVASMWAKTKNMTATTKDANAYAKLVSSKWFQLIQKEYGEGLEDGYKALFDSLKKNYAESAYYAKNVQSVTNKKAKVGMKALEPRLDDERLENLKTLLDDNGGDVLTTIGKDVVESFGRAATSDTLEANARIQEKAGLKTTMIRHLGSDGCCQWCQEMADGIEYEYGKQPDDFFRFHHDCDCWIEYKVSKGNLTRPSSNSHIRTSTY